MSNNNKIDLIRRKMRDAWVKENIYKKFQKVAECASNIEINNTRNILNFTIETKRPGPIIGKKGFYITEIKKFLSEMYNNKPLNEINISVIETNQKIYSRNYARDIANNLERSPSQFRRFCYFVMRNIIEHKSLGVIGVSIKISGKLSSQHSRVELFKEGKMKFSGETQNVNIDESKEYANTALGKLGILVRIMFDNNFPDRLVFKKTATKEEHRSNQIFSHSGLTTQEKLEKLKNIKI